MIHFFTTVIIFLPFCVICAEKLEVFSFRFFDVFRSHVYLLVGWPFNSLYIL